MDADRGAPEWPPEYQGSPHAGSRRSGAHARTTGRAPRTALLGPLAVAVGLVIVTSLMVYTAAAPDARCSGGETVSLTVAAAPEIAPAITRAAGRFNDARHATDGRCARAEVRAVDPLAVTTLLSGRGVAGLTRPPDVWIPDSSLWHGLAARGRQPTVSGRRSLASSPIVMATPRAAVSRTASGPSAAEPSWRDLLAAAGAQDGRSGRVRVRVPDPGRSATGMFALMLAGTLPEGKPGSAAFTGVVRTLRENLTPSAAAVFGTFRADASGPGPVVLASEQAVYAHNARGPSAPARAAYPAEGTFSLDYPFTFVGEDAVKDRASRLLERALVTGAAGRDLRSLGFRSPDGTAAPSSGDSTGVDPRVPRGLPVPAPGEVRRMTQAWARLSLGIRMLSVVDVSGSMEEEVAPGVSRMQATVRALQGGLALMPDDSELGQWLFATRLRGGQDWRETVGVGPLGERIGSATRRQLTLSALAKVRVEEDGDTGLYDTVLAAYRAMKRSYKPEFVNSIVVWTDGRNDDEDGPSLEHTLHRLRAEVDPDRPILVFMYGLGKGVDTVAHRKIAEVTRGSVLLAERPEEVQAVFLKALSQRICAPGC
ncbi:substrate-binding domain-containing protein [Spirillospora sp. CA-294931]|uniref:substrate-binding domain-containing protein n=1 Tax=Spirillospora sp. CA-294931 TaxID=3240042 RepID=UPI003D8AC041